MKRLFVFVLLATGSTLFSLSWLHDGELDEAIEPVVQSLDQRFSNRGGR